jgi:HAD superfamily hydrolase (TIGR01549 family)
MRPPEIKAVVLDLFDTLVKWEPDRLPLMELNGRQVHTTLPWIFPALHQRLGAGFDLQSFVEIYTGVVEEIAVEREREGIEITCLERFVRTMARIDAVQPSEAETLASQLTRIHMDGVRSVTWAPAERVEAVRRVAPHYRLGLLSNFDDAQCGREVLADTGVADLFEAVIISAEVRLRKPDQRIFQRMLQMLRLEPQQVLFVGDTPRDDVSGAHRAGMRTVWISKGAPGVPEGVPQPHFTIRDLSELPAILEI